MTEAEGPRLVRSEGLTDWTARILTRAGVRPTDARRVASILVDTDAAGISTHGVVLLPRIVNALRSQELNPRPRVRSLASRSAAAQLDGDNGIGQLVAWTAMAQAVRRARRTGIGLIAVSNTNHFGAAGTYVEQAAALGCWGLAVSNSIARVAPVGASQALLGTSPIALAALGPGQERLVVDVSTAAIARGKVRAAAREGHSLPAGVAQDAAGRPTTDAALAMAGLLLPLGGGRGLAVGLLVELLAVLGGGKLATDVPAADDRWGGLGLGQTFIAIAPEAFGAAPALAAQVGQLQARTRRLAGRAPGDRRQAARAETLRHGLPLSPSVYEQLRTLGAESAIPADL